MKVDINTTNKKYNIIYADPAWSYDDKHCQGACADKYDTMTLKDICDLPVNKIADKDCVLFIWGTYPKLAEMLTVVEAWGFKYKSIAFQWVKLNRKINVDAIHISTLKDLFKKIIFFGLGRWTRGNTEACFIATKGKPSRVSSKVGQLIFSPLTYHSHKPNEVREKIVELIGDKPRIELFARDNISSWDCWGNEAPEDNT